jgi:cytochrome P450
MSVSIPAPPDILSAEHDRDPWASYEVLREHYPVVFHEGTNSWLLSRHEHMAMLFKSKQVSSDFYEGTVVPVHGKTIVTMEGKEHSMHRRLLGPFFHTGGLQRFKPTIAAVAESLTQPILDRETAAIARGERARGEFDLVGELSRQMPITVIGRILGLPLADHDRFQAWYQGIMDFIGNLEGAPEPIERGLRAKQEMTDYFLPLIASRREGTDEDLITLMAQAEVDGDRLTDEEIRNFISLMLTAGGETTDRGISNLFLNLLRNPDQLAEVYEDRSLVTAAFAETLRHSGPVHVAGRTATEEIEIEGVTIPAGDNIITLLAAGNRDPRKFADPDRFDIHRTDNDPERAFTASADHLAYVNGRHFCAGAMLARTEVEAAANRLLDTMKDMRFADGFEPVETGLWTRGVDTLRVSFVPAT